MIFDAKFLTLFAFIVINFLIIFVIKTRTTIVTALIISHLIIVLFFSMSVSNYNSYKEIVLALIIYSMVILFLVSNYNSINLSDKQPSKKKDLQRFLIFAPPVFLIIALAFFAIFSLTKNISEISKIAQEEKTLRQENVLKNPMILPNHAAHIAVKKFYLGKKFKDEWPNKTYVDIEINERKKARLKDKLSDNFLLKRSSDVILLIVATSSSLLLLSSKKAKNNL
jgi:D-alanyl-lipoteichoic acid acyltransferase DltB (MBOAT superfamily)